MVKKVFFVGLFLFLLGALITYNLLGGFNSPELMLIPVEDPVEVAGLPYSGTPGSEEAERIFYEVRSTLTDHPGSHLIIVDYPAEEEDQVNYFIGISPVEKGSMKKIELEGFEKVVRIKFNKHNLVMPKPFKVREMAREYAASLGLSLMDFTIENYLSERELVIDFPVK